MTNFITSKRRPVTENSHYSARHRNMCILQSNRRSGECPWEHTNHNHIGRQHCLSTADHNSHRYGQGLTCPKIYTAKPKVANRKWQLSQSSSGTRCFSFGRIRVPPSVPTFTVVAQVLLLFTTLAQFFKTVWTLTSEKVPCPPEYRNQKWEVF